MFGYVRPYRPELKLREDMLFKAHYCGLCRALSAYGLPCRALLRYDLTFLYAVRCALTETEPVLCRRLCPWKCRTVASVEGPDAAYLAALHVLLAQEKCRDDRRDGGAGRLLSPLLALPAQKVISSGFGEAEEMILRMDREQVRLEKEGCADLDESAEPFSALLGGLFAYGARQEDAPALAWMGRNLGRWISWMDALDDHRKDREQGKYNVLIQMGLSREQAAERLQPLLALCQDQALAAWDSLQVERNDGIVRNVLELGLPRAAAQVIQERRNTDGPL